MSPLRSESMRRRRLIILACLSVSDHLAHGSGHYQTWIGNDVPHRADTVWGELLWVYSLSFLWRGLLYIQRSRIIATSITRFNKATMPASEPNIYSFSMSPYAHHSIAETKCMITDQLWRSAVVYIFLTFHTCGTLLNIDIKAPQVAKISGRFICIKFVLVYSIIFIIRLYLSCFSIDSCIAKRRSAPLYRLENSPECFCIGIHKSS